jgi:transposase-like protein
MEFTLNAIGPGKYMESSGLEAIGVNSEGYREILGIAECSRKDKESWSNFLRYLNERR